MGRPDHAHLVLHALRLKGFAPAGVVADLYDLDPAEVASALPALADEGLVSARRGGISPQGWTLTAAGRAEDDRLSGAELDAAGTRPLVEDVHRRFRSLNRIALDVITRWQVVDPDEGILNHHDDPVRDAALRAELATVDAEAQDLLDDLETALPRTRIHRPRLAAARARVDDGDVEWMAGASIDSYHTVWFELHEDLLVTLGIDRSDEGRT
ncbi:MAG: transcriptional regulator [Acidimicrobiales bacterium]